LFAAYLVAKFAGEMAIYNFFAKIVPVRMREKGTQEEQGWGN